jgi:hypothetical protein
LLKKPDFAAHWQPPALRHANQEADDFANIRRPSGVNETSVGAKVFEAAFEPSGSAVPLNLLVNRNALVGSSVVIHGSFRRSLPKWTERVNRVK